MRIENTDIEYHVDYIEKKIHLLDLDRDQARSLTNTISPDFQKRMVEQEGLLQDVLNFDWICYASDGIICSYSNYNFKFMNPKLPYLFEPFIEEMVKRRVTYKRGI